MEFQERGAPHFHIFGTWFPDKDVVATIWYNIVNSDDKRHLAAGTRVEFFKHGRAGMSSYASKYALKQEQKTVPENYQNCGRFWGVYGYRAVMSADTIIWRKDAKNGNIQTIIAILYADLQKYLLNGFIEVIIKADGVRVFAVNDKQVMRQLRILVCRLQASSMIFSDLFCDAEIDGGDNYGN